jgi:hypothetical protein
MELTENVFTDTAAVNETAEPMLFDESHLNGRSAELMTPKATESPPKEAATETPAASGGEIDAMPVTVFCRSLLERFEREPELSADARQTLMGKALGDLFAEQTLNDLALGEIAQALYEADTKAYEAWTDNQFKRGLVLAITTLGISGRLASNILALFRPQYIRELGVDSGVEMTMLDIAIGALYDYSQATMEVRRVTRSGEPRPVKVAAQHARTMASAQPMLKTFLTTIEKLRSKKQVRNLNIQAAGDVAIQVNEAGTSGSAEAIRAKDETVFVAKMEPPIVGAMRQPVPEGLKEAA